MEIEVQSRALVSEDKKYFALLSSDNQIKIYSIDDRKTYEHKPDERNPSAYTCATFGKTLTGDIDILALGNNKGEIKLYDFKRNSVINTLKEHNGPIQNLKFNQDSTSLFSSSSDKKLIRWDLTIMKVSFSYTIEKKGTISTVNFDLVDNENYLIYNIDNKINVYNLTTNTLERKFKGHTNSISFIKSIPKSTMFITTANNDSISLWNIESDNSLLNIPITAHSYQYFDCNKKSKNMIEIIACNPSSITIWSTKNMENGNFDYSMNVIKIQADEIVHASIYNNLSILVAVGSFNTEFAIVNIFQKGTKDMRNLEEISQDIMNTVNTLTSSHAYTKSKDKKGSSTKDYYILAETEYANAATNDKKQGGKERKNTVENAMDGSIIDMLKTEESITAKLDIGKMDSLAVVLLQALHNDDTQLLEYCLEQDDEDMIENTVKKILQSKLLLLLEKIIARLNTYYKKNGNLLIWLKYILKYHASFLMKIPAIQDKLTPLISMFKKRTQNFEQIHKLKGKLELLLAIEEDQKRVIKSKIQTIYKPQIVYEEGETIMHLGEKPKTQKSLISAKKKKQQQHHEVKVKEQEEDQEEEEQDEKEFSDSVSDSEEDIDENFDQYLNAHDDNEMSEDEDVSGEEDYIDLE